MQLDKLWQYMQVDMDADRFETKIRQSEKRQTLLKQRNFLMEQQNNMKKLENEVAEMADRLAAVEDEAERLQKLLDAQLSDIEQNPPQNAEDVNTKLDGVQKLLDTLTRYEQELTKMRKDADARDRLQREIRVRAARTKAEYDQLKQEYDVEYKSATAQLKKMRERTAREAEKIDVVLMGKYNEIKQHCTPPMAKLIDGKCTGCFMSLASASLLALKNADGIVCCDNCDRIIYIEDK